VIEIKTQINLNEFLPENFILAQKEPSPQKTVLQIITEYEKGEKVATRQAYGNALIKLGEQNKEMFVLDGDVKNSTKSEDFFKNHPEKSLECFIAEQNMISLALGMSARGKKVFAATFAAFLSRAHDQIRMAAYADANIKLAGSHTGVSIGKDGPSQMGLEDIAMMRSILGSIVLSPSDAVSAEKLTCLAANYEGISYVRIARPKTPVIYQNDESFKIGGSKMIRMNKNDTIVVLTTGIVLNEVIRASEILENANISIRIIDCYSIKPLDDKTLIEHAIMLKRPFLTVEDHYEEGGFGEAVSSILSGYAPVHHLCVHKKPHSGDGKKLMAEQGLTAEKIAETIERIVY
jgi:transketolase